jgi:hypothetical protein
MVLGGSDMNRALCKRSILLLCAVAAWAQTTIVTGPVTGPDGKATTGTVYISISAPCTYSGNQVVQKTIEAALVPSGNPQVTTLAITLVPNAGGCVGTSYTVSWAITGMARFSTSWVVPISLTPVTIASVTQGTVPPAPAQLNPSQIMQNGATPGQGLVWNSITGWTPQNVGAAQCLITVTYSAAPVFNFAACNQQQITLTGNVTPVIQNANNCQVAGGCTITFIQGGSGGYTVTWTGAVTGGFSIGGIAGKHNVQTFTSLDGSTLLGLNPGEINQ